MNLLRDVWILITSLWRCPHPNPGMPVNGRQHCYTCGAFRFYEIGGRRSPWYRYQYEGHGQAPPKPDKGRPS